MHTQKEMLSERAREGERKRSEKNISTNELN